MKDLASTLLTLISGLLIASTSSSQDIPADFPTEIASGVMLSEPGISTSTLKVSFPYSPGVFQIAVHREERQTPNDEWVFRKRIDSTNYIITAVSARRGGEVLFVAGMKADGTSIIERWWYDYPDGRFITDYIDPTPPLSAPLTEPYRPTIAIRGGTWKPIRGVPAPKKTIVYEGPEGPFTVMQADPEGRFLLLYDYSLKSLRKIDTGNPGVISTLYTAQEHPQLLELGSMEARDRTSGERVIVLWKMLPNPGPLSSEVFTLIFDSNNDGAFETIEVFTYADYKNSQYWDPSEWVHLWRGL